MTTTETPMVWHDASASRSNRNVRHVLVPEVQVPIPNNSAGITRASLPRRVVCETGRILGSRDKFASAEIRGGTSGLTADECRALAEALVVAADVLDGTHTVEAVI